MNSVAKSGEIDDPKAGDSVVSRCGIIKVTVEKDGIISIMKLTQEKRSFNIQLYYAGQAEPATVVFRTNDPTAYRLDSRKRLTKLKIISNPI